MWVPTYRGGQSVCPEKIVSQLPQLTLSSATHQRMTGKLSACVSEVEFQGLGKRTLKFWERPSLLSFLVLHKVKFWSLLLLSQQ